MNIAIMGCVVRTSVHASHYSILVLTNKLLEKSIDTYRYGLANGPLQ